MTQPDKAAPREPDALLGMIAEIYSGLDAEDAAWVDYQWMKFRNRADNGLLEIEQCARRWARAFHHGTREEIALQEECLLAALAATGDK